MTIEPQQPEGELAKSNSYSHSCITPYPAVIMSKCHACVWDEATAFMIAQGYRKLPSEDELRGMIERCKVWDGEQETTGARKLLKLLKEQK